MSKQNCLGNTFFMKQTLKYILQYLLENIKLAETKHSIAIALNGAIIALALTFLSNTSSQVRFLNWLVLFFCGFSIIISFFALHSRNVNVKKKFKHTDDKNLLYYKNLAQMSSSELLENIILYYDFPADYKIDNFDIDLALTIIANSKVVSLKYTLFNQSTFFSIIGIIFALVMFAMVGISV